MRKFFKVLVLLALTSGLMIPAAWSATAAESQSRSFGGETFKSEARKIKAPENAGRWLPSDECTRWKYLGKGRKDRTNGRAVWSVRSRIDSRVWHTFKVRKHSVGLDHRGQCVVAFSKAPKGKRHAS